MSQPFVITGNIEFSGNKLLEGQVEERDRPFWLTCDRNVQSIAH